MASTSSALIICALIGFACALERGHNRSVPGNPAIHTLKDGRLQECSAQHCTVTAKVDDSFHWTPELRAATEGVISESEAFDKKKRNHTKGFPPGQACYPPTHVTDYTEYPANLIGKIHFRNPRNYGYRCTGAFVGDYAMVLTAAHCCYNFKKEEWNKDWEITLGYDDGGGTSYQVERAFVSDDWIDADYEDHAYDFCILKMKDSGPSYLAYWIADPDDFFDYDYVYSYGYAQNYGTGKELYCAYSHMYDYDVDGDYDGYLIAKCNPMIHGNSGGPWIVAYKGVIGVNSYHTIGHESREGSPYLGTDFVKLCQRAGFCQDDLKSLRSSSATSNNPIVFM